MMDAILRKPLLTSLTLVIIALASAVVLADTVVLSEGFEGVAGGTYFTGTTVNQFKLEGGAVEVLATNNEAGRCTGAGGSPTCVNLVGSPPDPTTFVSSAAFAPGTYNLSFDLAGSQLQGGQANTTFLFFGNLVNIPITLAANSSFFTHSFPNVTVAFDSPITFFDSGVSGAGNLLDNVQIVRVAAVPVPATLSLLMTGLAGLGAAVRRRNAEGVKRSSK